MPQFISPPPMMLQQPMTGYTQWNTPMGVVPLVGYPSAYPHVVDMTRRSYAAEVLSPEVYQAMAYRPAPQPQQPAPAKKAPVKRRAVGGGQSQTTRRDVGTRSAPVPPTTPSVALAPAHTPNKYNVLKPAHTPAGVTQSQGASWHIPESLLIRRPAEPTPPAQPVQIIPQLAPARSAAKSPSVSPVTAVLEAASEYVPAEYILGNTPTSTLDQRVSPQRPISPIESVLNATSEYVPASYILGGAPAAVTPQSPAAQRPISPVEAVLNATSEYVPTDYLKGGNSSQETLTGLHALVTGTNPFAPIAMPIAAMDRSLKNAAQAPGHIKNVLDTAGAYVPPDFILGGGEGTVTNASGPGDILLGLNPLMYPMLASSAAGIAAEDNPIDMETPVPPYLGKYQDIPLAVSHDPHKEERARQRQALLDVVNPYVPDAYIGSPGAANGYLGGAESTLRDAESALLGMSPLTQPVVMSAAGHRAMLDSAIKQTLRNMNTQGALAVSHTADGYPQQAQPQTVPPYRPITLPFFPVY